VEVRRRWRVTPRSPSTQGSSRSVRSRDDPELRHPCVHTNEVHQGFATCSAIGVLLGMLPSGVFSKIPDNWRPSNAA